MGPPTGVGKKELGVQTGSYIILITILLGMFLIDLSVGSVSIPLKEVFNILRGAETAKSSWEKIILLFRLPKAITAAISGAALALSGLLMQTLFRNPLAGPYVLGINAGASLGVALVVMLAGSGSAAFMAGIGLVGKSGMIIAASLGSASVLFLVLIFSRKVESIMTLLILGLLFGHATGAIVNILMHFSIAEKVHTYIAWTFGSFSAVTWQELSIYAPLTLATVIVAQLLAKPLNALLLGEHYAKSLGVHMGPLRIFIIIITAILAAAVTVFCGPVAFIGVAIPHLARSLFHTADHKVLLPSAALLGAIIAVMADILSTIPGQGTVVPLNAVTALIGTPVIAWIILRRKNIQETFAS